MSDSDVMYDWYGMLLTLLLIITLMLAIYACCNHCAADNTVGLSVFRQRSVAPHTTHTTSHSPPRRPPADEREPYQLEVTPSPPLSRVHNTANPFIFLPPAYDTLPKDPPKYEDIYLVNCDVQHSEINTTVQPDLSTTDVETCNEHQSITITDVEVTRNH